MTKDKALELALEALIYASSYCDTYDAITAIKQALAAPVQDVPEVRFGNMAAPVQEPVAWIRGSGLEMLKLENGGVATVYASEAMSNHSSPLYTTPPATQRQWVEVEQIKWDGDKLIAKLKEKNNG